MYGHMHLDYYIETTETFCRRANIARWPSKTHTCVGGGWDSLLRLSHCYPAIGPAIAEYRVCGQVTEATAVNHGWSNHPSSNPLMPSAPTRALLGVTPRKVAVISRKLKGDGLTMHCVRPRGLDSFESIDSFDHTTRSWLRNDVIVTGVQLKG